MNEQKIYKLRPLPIMCGSLCFITGMLTFLLILAGITENIIQFVFIGILFAVINAILFILSMRKWNSFVYIDDEKITQYQWGKEIIIFYEEIEKVKYFKQKGKIDEPRISLYSNGNKITFGEIYVLPKFLEKMFVRKSKK